MIDIIHANQSCTEKSLITGRLIERQVTLDKAVRMDKIIAYNRTSALKRIITWCWGFIQILWIVKTRYTQAHLFIVTNPPFNTFLPLLCKNSFSVLVFDVYPDALLSYKVFRKISFLSAVWEKANRKVYAKAERIYTVSPGMKNMLCKYTSAENITVVPLWSNNNLVKPVPKSENEFIRKYKLQDKFIVMYSGNLGRTHNVEAIIDVAAALHDTDILFLIIGDGDKKEQITTAVNEKQLSNVCLLPWQPASMLMHSLSAADIGIVTLSNEAGNFSIPSKIFDLISTGTPLLCIANKHTELVQLVSKYGIGKSFTKENVKEMAAYILELKHNPATCQQLQQNALAASRDFTPKNSLKFAEA
ncbi:MAG TPA: glycosyltransferase family 4 protein [Ferruginibacter sp.]|nr:glycosyltransferase family 4 protein [Ferruginibacter sp.]HMP19631.1 glycosyltransferase family 4 protein [Ferruginibacter sp.]